MTDKNHTKPTHHAYSVKESNGKNHWTKLGTAWQHLDGKGFNITLDALPTDGRITLRTIKDEIA